MKHTLIRTLTLAAKTAAKTAVLAAVMATTGAVLAKLPPLSDEAKAKADEAKAKAAHGDKLAGFQLCKAMDKVADGYQAAARKAGKPASAALATPACADPGAFVYPPPAAASGAAAPAVAAAPAKK